MIDIHVNNGIDLNIKANECVEENINIILDNVHNIIRHKLDPWAFLEDDPITYIDVEILHQVYEKEHRSREKQRREILSKHLEALNIERRLGIYLNMRKRRVLIESLKCIK